MAINPPDYPDKLLDLNERDLPAFITEFLDLELVDIERTFYYLFGYSHYVGLEKEEKIGKFTAYIKEGLEKLREIFCVHEVNEMDVLFNRALEGRDLSIINGILDKVDELIEELEKIKNENKHEIANKINGAVQELAKVLEFKEKLSKTGYYNILLESYKFYTSQDLSDPAQIWEIENNVKKIKDKKNKERAEVISNWVIKYYCTEYATTLVSVFISKLLGLKHCQHSATNLSIVELEKVFEITYRLDKKRRQEDYKKIIEWGGSNIIRMKRCGAGTRLEFF